MTDGSIIFESSDGQPDGIASVEDISKEGIMLALKVLCHADDLNAIGDDLAESGMRNGPAFGAVLAGALQWTANSILNGIYVQRPDFKAFLQPELEKQSQAFRDSL